MSVVNGQDANATIFNGAFVSRTQNTSTVGTLTLNNTSSPFSGAQITNTQRYINEIAAALGLISEGDATALQYASNFWLQDGDSHKASLERLDGAFDPDPAFGHTHDGSDSALIAAADLDGLNYFRAEWQMFDLLAASGSSIDISAEMASKTPGGADTVAGVVTDPPLNRVEIREKITETYVEDGEGQRVYGRITEAAGVWTLSFYTNEAGVETAHILALQDILVAFKEVFTLGTIPTFGADAGVLGSFDLAGDIVYATDVVAGKVLLADTEPPAVGPGLGAVGVSTRAAREDHTHDAVSSEPDVEYRTITGGEAAAKQLTLLATPLTASKVLVDAIGGGAQEYGVDFTVTGTTLSWSGLGLDSIPLSAGDKLRIVYWS